MFTIFHGFHLVEAYHEWKKEHRSNKNPMGLKVLKLVIAVAVALFLWIAPSDLYGLPGLNPVQHRVLSIFAFAALMWLFDSVPAWTTSLLVVVLLLFCTSDSALWFFQTDYATGSKFENLVSNTALLHCFCRPYHHAVYRWFYRGYRRYQEWSRREVGQGDAGAFRHQV